MLEAKFIPGCADKSAVFQIRERVFIEEQGFSRETEFDAVDETALHVLVLLGGDPAATARLYQQDGCWHIGRVAVRKEHRGLGAGAAAMRLLMGKARQLGAREVFVGAQVRAEGFYAGLGFVPCGPGYLDEGVPHVPMKAALQHDCPCACQEDCREGRE